MEFRFRTKSGNKTFDEPSYAALLMYISQKNMVSCWIFLGFYLPHIIHVWYTYLHMVDSFLWLNHVRIHTTTVVPWKIHALSRYQVLQTHRIDPRFRQAFAPGPFPKAEGGPSQWRGRRGRWSRWWGAQRGGFSPSIGGRKVISLLGRCGSFFWLSIPDKKKNVVYLPTFRGVKKVNKYRLR